MKREFMRLAGGLALAAALVSVAPCAAFAAGTTADTQSGGGISEITPQADEPVAEINGVQYTDIDEAIDAASAGDTITLLSDVKVTKTFYKSLTFTGGYKLTVDAYSWRYNGDLIFDAADFEMVVDADSPAADNGEISRWLGMALSNGSIVARNGADVTFSFDSVTGTNCAIYGTNADIIVENGSTFGIYGKNTAGVQGQGLQLDSEKAVGIKVTGNSTFLIDGTNRGYVCSPDIYVEDSTFKVQNCTANASNGGLFEAVNSEVKFDNNDGHGLSAGNVVIDGSTVTTTNNGYCGFVLSGNLDIKNKSVITVTGNAWHDDSNNAAYAGFRLNGGSTSNVYNIDGSTTLTIADNYNTGLDVRRGTLTIANGAKVTISGNSVTNTDMAGYGGGIYVGYSTQSDWAKATIPSDALICNNHALNGGDDIYVATGVEGARSSLTIIPVADGQSLDGTKLVSSGSRDSRGSVADDCIDSIDGWYLDGMNEEGALDADKRWEAHADSYDSVYAEQYAVDETVTVEGPLALKAAHGLGVVAVDPADITIYMGGDEGYEGTATENGSISGSNSLPEPGFYFVLSDDINQAFAEADIADLGVAADLSQYMTIYTHGYNGENGELHWKLEKYGENNSEAYGQFIYRIVPAPTAGQEAVPVRLQFTGEDGTTVTSDEFDPSAAGTLSQKYTMQLYTELVQKDQVVFEVDIKGQKFYNSMELQTGDLNVRYVTGDQDDVVSDVLNSEAELAAAKAEDPNKAFALHPEGTTYYINNSKVDIADGIAPSLLFDDVVSDHNTTGAEDYDQQLASRAVDVATSAGADFENPYFQAKYLDLVDANNGNVWLTASEPTTVYWPYPAGTNENTEFHLVHFTDLDREMNNSAIDGAIDSSATEYVAVENTEHGIRFTTDGFSPFVLIWDAGTEAGPQPEPPVIPTEPSKPGNGLPTTGDYSLMGAAAAAVAGIAVIGCGIHMARKSH